MLQGCGGNGDVGEARIVSPASGQVSKPPYVTRHFHVHRNNPGAIEVQHGLKPR